ncbi:YycH family regulatory protein [Calidifontibacillus erzurumensis]|uniref:Regulatory protein YycH domain-containing protein n=1 Tax=Calidifontibacillus erzurumensis TaxID=2741433 RepID=A0A8J8GEH0_9BACI|nr:two-component system activity regulator YycH [Calidifontibacillus erzurumensis]NSL52384.1 hypothetical protein [Calidifontibacillus erzurumensis]
MKMNFERTKSVVLLLLVLLSLALTWGLWTFQPQYDFGKRANKAQVVTIGEKRQFNEVITPIQFIYHHGGYHYGLLDDWITNDLYHIVMDVNVLDYEYLDHITKRGLLDTLHNGSSLELVFPVQLPVTISNYIMKPVRQEWDIASFDRIFVHISKNPALYLIATAGDQAIKLPIDMEDVRKIQEKIGQVGGSKQLFFSINARDGQRLYLPDNQISLTPLTFTTARIPPTEIKNALFPDPNGVKQYRLNNGEESFTDEIRALEILQNQTMLRYVNPAKQDVYGLEPEELILKSVEFVNDHSGWTDSYMLIDWKKANQSVQFQLMVNGYPVFHPNGMTTIYESWSESEVYEYNRSLINLRFQIDNGQESILLPSGRELLSYLTQVKPNFSLSLLEFALIGYEIEKKDSDFTVATIQPSWFIKYDGKWEKVSIPNR